MRLASRSISKSTAGSILTPRRLCVDAGADVLVAGSATFKGGPERYAANIAALKGGGTDGRFGGAPSA